MNLIELSDKFPTELSCIEFAEKVRFGKQLRCAYCEATDLSKRHSDLKAPMPYTRAFAPKRGNSKQQNDDVSRSGLGV